MRYTIKKSVCFLFAAFYLFSMSGCFLVRRAVKNVISPTTTLSPSQSADNLSVDVRSDLMGEISITNCNDVVLEDEEVKYFVVKEVYRDDRSRNTELYDYDRGGRLKYYKSESNAYANETDLVYNDDGTLARKDYRTLKSLGSAPSIPFYSAKYEYNDKKQLVSFSYSTDGVPDITYKFEYENGHLVHTDYIGKDYTYSTESEYYDYCVVVSDSPTACNEQDDVRICKRTYADDTFEKVLTEQYEYDERVTHFEYDGDVMTGWYYVDKWGKTIKWNAKGDLTAELDKDGSVIQKWEYNEYGDSVLYEKYSGSVLVDKITTTITYNGSGGKLTETSDYWHLRNGEEITFTGTITYSYRNGLLVSEVDEIDGLFSSMKVYAYKAFVVPKENKEE